MSTVSEIREMRSEILRVNSELRLLTNLAQKGNVTFRDLLVLTRLLASGSPELSRLMANLQATIAVAQTTITTLRLLKIEMGPIGWALLAIGTFAGLTMLSEMEMRRPQY